MIDHPPAASPSGHAATPVTSRAGRDLPRAIAVGVALGALALTSLFVVKLAFLLLTVLAVCLGVHELVTALRQTGVVLPLYGLWLCTVGIVGAAYFGSWAVWAGSVAVGMLIAVVWPRPQVHASASGLLASLLTVIYLPVLASFAMFMLRENDGAERILVFLALVVANDVGGYATGVLVGRHPIAPSLSPKKSWEGFAGSLVTSWLVAGVALPVLWDTPWYFGLAVGTPAVIAATVGDFAESSLKRDMGIKDMSSLLPGHGGVLDRLDSMLAAAPVVWALLVWVTR